MRTTTVKRIKIGSAKRKPRKPEPQAYHPIAYERADGKVKAVRCGEGWTLVHVRGSMEFIWNFRKRNWDYVPLVGPFARTGSKYVVTSEARALRKMQIVQLPWRDL